MKLLCCVGGQVKHLVDYQLEVDKRKLTAVANFIKATLKVAKLQNKNLSFKSVPWLLIMGFVHPPLPTTLPPIT